MSHHEMLSPQISAVALIDYQRAMYSRLAITPPSQWSGLWVSSLSINSREAPANDRCAQCRRAVYAGVHPAPV
jgi:hypothetical protein